jgi:type II secretory pathway component PulK
MKSRRGVALLLVLWIVVLLGGVGASVIAGARASSNLAGNARARVAARYAAESGIEATRAEIEQVLAGDSVRASYLNGLEREPRDAISLGDARVQVTVVDPGARLDINAAPVRNLSILFGAFTDAVTAERMGLAVRSHIERRTAMSNGPTVTPLRSLEELRAIPGMDQEALRRAAPFLTVDGDGSVNTAHAPRVVLDAAFGELRDTPSRLTIISRGWTEGHPLTHEIQSVYALSNGTLVLVDWRERVL